MARPAFTPTNDQRAKVRSMAAMGIRHDEIALKIGIRSAKTLRKYFRTELDLAAAEANYKVAAKAYEMASSGQHPAMTMFWLKCRAGWHERPVFEPAPVPPPPFIVTRETQGDQQ